MQTLREGVSRLEYGIADIQILASITSYLAEKGIRHRGRLEDAEVEAGVAEMIVWTAHRTEKLVAELYAEWSAANAIGFELRRADA